MSIYNKKHTITGHESEKSSRECRADSAELCLSTTYSTSSIMSCCSFPFDEWESQPGNIGFCNGYLEEYPETETVLVLRHLSLDTCTKYQLLHTTRDLTVKSSLAPILSLGSYGSTVRRRAPWTLTAQIVHKELGRCVSPPR